MTYCSVSRLSHCDILFSFSSQSLWHTVHFVVSVIVTYCSVCRHSHCDILFTLSCQSLWHIFHFVVSVIVTYRPISSAKHKQYNFLNKKCNLVVSKASILKQFILFWYIDSNIWIGFFILHMRVLHYSFLNSISFNAPTYYLKKFTIKITWWFFVWTH